MIGKVGIEPTTCDFKDRRAANCATPQQLKVSDRT
jgi:hypothetical protein